MRSMNESARNREVEQALAHAPARFRSLLVAVDLSPFSDRVLGRVALLPLTSDARVTLFHAVPGGLPPREQRRAARHANRALAAEVRHLAKSLPRTVRIEPIVETGPAYKTIAARARSSHAELIVMGRAGGRAVRDMVLGSTAERVIRQAQLPVLVVRLAPRSAYKRPAIALELDHAAHDIIGLMLRVIPSPRPPVAVIHAFDVPYSGCTYGGISKEDAERWKLEHQREAYHAIGELLAASLAKAKVDPEDAPLLGTFIRYGSPRLVIEKTVEKADTDLLVLGSRGHSGMAYMFLGTVAGDVLRNVACDVLVVPPRAAAKAGGR
jgi:nucleotide-binding universal stress UspA family protein